MNISFPLLALCGFSQLLSAYDLHEWGTFTTVSGSDGGLLAGLHVEEEHLPPFVYSHIGMTPQGSLAQRQKLGQVFVMQDREKFYHRARGLKGMPKASLKNVTVKMETPVIYFYGDDTAKVNVKVGFNGGTISQWYPQRKSGDTPNLVEKEKVKLSDALKKTIGESKMVTMKPIDFSNPYYGSIEWDVEILPKSEADPALTFKPYENTTWIYPRVSDANILKVGNEYEDFLFYRGVGNFDLPATFSVDSSETLQVANHSKEAIPFAFAFENIAGNFRFKTLGEIPAGAAAKVAETDWEKASEGESQQIAVFQQLRAGLVSQGLTSDEANGMIKTWWKSYFNKPGLRVFWIVPQIDLERILPLSADPKPTSQVRVLVGRADVMRPKFEKQLLTDLGTSKFSAYHGDRFMLPYMNRLRELVKKPVYLKLEEYGLASSSLKIIARQGNRTEVENLRLYIGRDVKLNKIKLAGPWEIVDANQLKIGETIFTLNPETGLLSSPAFTDPNSDTYEIQLPKVLN